MYLYTAYADDPVILGMYLATQLFTAAGDLGVKEMTAELLDRFLTWAQSHSFEFEGGHHVH